jgi:hypothetical protein
MRKPEETLPTSRTGLAGRRADLERLEAQVAEWTALIGQFRASARRAEPATRRQLDHLTDELQSLRNEASAQVMRLKGVAEADWELERAVVERSWLGVHSSFRRAQARLG